MLVTRTPPTEGECPLRRHPVEDPRYLPSAHGLPNAPVCRRHLPPGWYESRLQMQARHELAEQVAEAVHGIGRGRAVGAGHGSVHGAGHGSVHGAGHGSGNIAPGRERHDRDRDRRTRHRESGRVRRRIRKRLAKVLVAVFYTDCWILIGCYQNARDRR